MESAHKYLWPLVIGALSVVCIGVSVFLLVKPVQTPEPIEFSSGEVEGESTIGLIKVDVEGSVGQPGVYDLPADARIEDALTAAGGLTADADADYIAKKLNRAARVVDGGKIYIPSHNNSFATLASEDIPETSSSISINDATISQLDTLPGIGPVTAQKIIDNRPYQTLEELLTKKAVGQSVYSKILELICL